MTAQEASVIIGVAMRPALGVQGHAVTGADTPQASAGAMSFCEFSRMCPLHRGCIKEGVQCRHEPFSKGCELRGSASSRFPALLTVLLSSRAQAEQGHAHCRWFGFLRSCLLLDTRR